MVLNAFLFQGNNWGNCPNGTGAVGCGPQEEFRACADISITSKSPGDVEPTEYPEDIFPATTTITSTTANVTDVLPEPEESYDPLTAIIISIVSFLAIFLVLFLLYFHYYQVGKQVKNWMKAKPGKGAEKTTEVNTSVPPLPPPRVKKTRTVSENSMQEISLSDEVLA